MIVTSRMLPPSFATVSINCAYVNSKAAPSEPRRGSSRRILARMLVGLYTQSVEGCCRSSVVSVQLSKDALSSSDTSPATRSNAIASAGSPAITPAIQTLEMPSSLNSVRVQFFRRSPSSFEASPNRPDASAGGPGSPGSRPQFWGAAQPTRPPFRAARTMAAYATMDKAPVCTAELIMLAHARLPPNQRPPCGDMHLVWLLIGKELGDQLSKRRGVRLEGLGDIILTVDGIRLVKGGNLRGARPHILSISQP